ncbi:Protein MAIN-LIKE 2 [Glycine soja]
MKLVLNGDVEEVPQRRRLRASACRQRAAVAVAENVEHIDHVADEVHEKLQEPVTDDERTKLKLTSHGRKINKFGRSAPEIEGIVTSARLSSLITCSLDNGDKELLYAFAERWHKETSSFHLPVGEVTIALNDVASLLHLPIKGVFHTLDALDVDQAVELLVELLEVSTQEAKDETEQCRGAYICLT